MNVIEVKNLWKIYREKHALQDLTFTIKKNTITGLIGKNGAGKTTLLKILAGYYLPSSGTVKVFSENPFNSLKVSSNLIFIDDQMSFPPTLSLGDILKSAASFYPNWNMNLAMGLFDYFDLKKNANHQNLSKGMKSTFNMIIGLAARCPLTIFDEPTTGMDASVRKDFYKALLKDYLEHPRTIILSSHLLNEIDRILEDILLIRHGEMYLHETVDDLKEFAVGIRGKSEEVRKITKNLEVVHEETYGTSYTFVVVKNTPDLQTKLINFQVQTVPIPVADLCVYLTNTKKRRD